MKQRSLGTTPPLNRAMEAARWAMAPRGRAGLEQGGAAARAVATGAVAFAVEQHVADDAACLDRAGDRTGVLPADELAGELDCGRGDVAPSTRRPTPGER